MHFHLLYILLIASADLCVKIGSLYLSIYGQRLFFFNKINLPCFCYHEKLSIAGNVLSEVEVEANDDALTSFDIQVGGHPPCILMKVLSFNYFNNTFRVSLFSFEQEQVFGLPRELEIPLKLFALSEDINVFLHLLRSGEFAKQTIVMVYFIGLDFIFFHYVDEWGVYKVGKLRFFGGLFNSRFQFIFDRF